MRICLRLPSDPLKPEDGEVTERAARAANATAPRVPSPVTVRLWAALFLAGSLVVLGMAAWLKPDPRGFGTHQQLVGQGPCGMLVLTGLPCPTCGMTTAFAYTVRGQWLRAILAQPAGFVFALTTVGLAGFSGAALVRGRWPRARLIPRDPQRVFLGLLILLLGAWAFKIVFGLATHTLPYR